jgi:uncharacterized membrane protein
LLGEWFPGRSTAKPEMRLHTQLSAMTHRVPLDAAAALAAGVLAGVLIALGWDSPVRVALALAFLLFGPGLAVAELLGVSDGALRLAVATGFSLALETLVGLALLYAGAYTAGLTFSIALAFAVVVFALALARRPPGSPASGGAAV